MKQSKQLNDKPTSIVTVDTEETLTKLAKQQEPIEIPVMVLCVESVRLMFVLD